MDKYSKIWFLLIVVWLFLLVPSIFVGGKAGVFMNAIALIPISMALGISTSKDLDD